MKDKVAYNLLQVIAFAMIFLCTTDVVAQTVSRQVIGTTGGSTQFNNIKLDWTVGEAIIGKAISTDGPASATIGFQQPTLSILPLTTALIFPVMLSPNPTPDLVNITLRDPSMQDLRLTLSQANGQVLVPALLLNPWKNELDLSAYPAGMYIITIKDGSTGMRQAHKLVKY